MPAPVLLVLLALACRTPCERLSEVEIEDPEAVASETERALAEAALDQFADWTGRATACVATVRFAEDLADDEVVPDGPFDVAGYYTNRDREVVIAAGQGDETSRILRHELCHGLDWSERISERYPSLFDAERLGEAADLYDPAFHEEEAFARACEAPPPPLLDRVEDACGDPIAGADAAVAQVMVQHVYRDRAPVVEELEVPRDGWVEVSGLEGLPPAADWIAWPGGLAMASWGGEPVVAFVDPAAGVVTRTVAVDLAGRDASVPVALHPWADGVLALHEVDGDAAAWHVPAVGGDAVAVRVPAGLLEGAGVGDVLLGRFGVGDVLQAVDVRSGETGPSGIDERWLLGTRLEGIAIRPDGDLVVAGWGTRAEGSVQEGWDYAPVPPAFEAAPVMADGARLQAFDAGEGSGLWGARSEEAYLLSEPVCGDEGLEVVATADGGFLWLASSGEPPELVVREVPLAGR